MNWLILLLAVAPFLVLGAVTSNPRAGKGGRVRVGGINLTMQNWQSNDTTEALDASNFEGAGFTEWLDGLRSCDWSAQMVWNASQRPYADPPSFVPGTFLNDLQAFVSVSDNDAFNFPSFFVLSVATTVNVHQAVQVAISGKSDGEFTVPD